MNAPSVAARGLVGPSEYSRDTSCIDGRSVPCALVPVREPVVFGSSVTVPEPNIPGPPKPDMPEPDMPVAREPRLVTVSAVSPDMGTSIAPS